MIWKGNFARTKKDNFVSATIILNNNYDASNFVKWKMKTKISKIFRQWLFKKRKKKWLFVKIKKVDKDELKRKYSLVNDYI